MQDVAGDNKRPSSFVGCRILSLRGVNVAVRPPNAGAMAPPEPRWLPLLESGTHASGGEVLISLELLPIDPNLPQEPPLPAAGSVVGAVGGAVGAVITAPGKGLASMLGLAAQREASAKAARAAELDAAADDDTKALNAFTLPEPPVQRPLTVADCGLAPLRNAPALARSREPMPLDISDTGIQPPGTNARLHILVVGLRGLERPFSVNPRSLNPFIEVDVAAFQRRVADEVLRTRPSNMPSMMNPTYLEKLNVGLALADDP